MPEDLDGDPYETFGVLFGPTEKDGLCVSARILGTGKGRRFRQSGTHTMARRVKGAPAAGVAQ